MCVGECITKCLSTGDALNSWPQKRHKPQLREATGWPRKGASGCGWIKLDSDLPNGKGASLRNKELYLPHTCLFHQRNEKNQGVQHDGSFAASTVSDNKLIKESKQETDMQLDVCAD